MIRENNYKVNLIKNNMKKRGQVAIFVIIAIVIVAGIFLYFFISNENFKNLFVKEEFTPTGFLEDCVKSDVDESVKNLAKNGGYSDPKGTIRYQGEDYKYLCYNSEYYKLCVVQQPLIKGNFETELNNILKPRAEQCTRLLVQEYEKRGYDVSASEITAGVSILPDNIEISVDVDMSVRGDESSFNFDGFKANVKSGMYQILMISTSIIEFETTFGDSEVTEFMQYYPDLKIEKYKMSEGSTLYTVTNVISGESFRFASRSLAWPPGLGIE